MKELYWETCQYLSSEDCPNQSAISKAILIPQLLDPSKIEAIKELCRNCENCRNEKRINLRVNRPIRVTITSKELQGGIEGNIINVSLKGALIQLSNWIDVQKEELVDLQLHYDSEVPDQSKTNIISQRSIIRRIAREKGQIAVVFIDDIEMGKTTNF